MPTPLYHITAIENLAGVIKAGGLWCDNLIATQTVGAVCAANNEIKERRRTCPVINRATRKIICKGGNVPDYVPFYFAPRSPMLYAIRNQFGVSYKGGQESIVHLASSAENVAERGLDFCFTDGHAIMNTSEFYEDLDDLKQIDWPVMKLAMWNDTPLHPDRKRKRQAEFLVHHFFPWEAIEYIGVDNVEMKTQVLNIISAIGHQPKVGVQRAWYYH